MVTYLEYYRSTHPEENDKDIMGIVKAFCPDHTLIDLELKQKISFRCPHHLCCSDCWDQQIPEGVLDK